MESSSDRNLQTPETNPKTVSAMAPNRNRRGNGSASDHAKVNPTTTVPNKSAKPKTTSSNNPDHTQSSDNTPKTRIKLSSKRKSDSAESDGSSSCKKARIDDQSMDMQLQSQPQTEPQSHQTPKCFQGASIGSNDIQAFHQKLEEDGSKIANLQLEFELRKHELSDLEKKLHKQQEKEQIKDLEIKNLKEQLQLAKDSIASMEREATSDRKTINKISKHNAALEDRIVILRDQPKNPEQLEKCSRVKEQTLDSKKDLEAKIIALKRDNKDLGEELWRFQLLMDDRDKDYEPVSDGYISGEWMDVNTMLLQASGRLKQYPTSQVEITATEVNRERIEKLVQRMKGSSAILRQYQIRGYLCERIINDILNFGQPSQKIWGGTVGAKLAAACVDLQSE